LLVDKVFAVSAGVFRQNDLLLLGHQIVQLVDDAPQITSNAKKTCLQALHWAPSAPGCPTLLKEHLGM
jgi:hypothetical protein